MCGNNNERVFIQRNERVLLRKQSHTQSHTHMADPNSYLIKGAEIEISSDDADFRGSWYIGTVISRSKNKVIVEYKTLVSDEDDTKFLREKVDASKLRPPAPREKFRRFSSGEVVDAYHNDGWWVGVIVRVKGDDIYTVYFKGTKEELDFGLSELRLHRQWVGELWVPPLDKGNQIALNTKLEEPSKNIIQKCGTTAEVTSDNANVEKPCNIKEFAKGTLVEVTSDEEGFQGAWFAATIYEKLSNDEYLIEYQNLTDDDDTQLLKEKANVKHIRPCPPEIAVTGCFRLLEEVDAHYNDGWWAGVICKVLEGQKYTIYFREPNEELEFKQSELRPHQDWIDGKWVLASQALKL